MNKHDTLLLSCGTQENRRYMRHLLGERYHLLEAGNAQQTMLLMRQNQDCIAAMILDISTPQALDVSLLQEPEQAELLKSVPVIILCAEDSPDLLHRAFHCGAADVIPLDYEPYALLCRIEAIVNMHLNTLYFENMVREQASALQQSNETIVDALSSIIEYRSTESGQHILRVRHFTRILLEELSKSCPEYGLNERSIALISSAAALHDIGKVAIPDFVLMKRGRLTPEERTIMNTHSRIGCQILDTISGVVDKEYLCYAYNICHYHHERWDGGGYPEGLKGDEIPICAQAVGLADAYDALSSKRIYRDACSHSYTVNCILRGECGAFSPKLLECFKHVTQPFEELARAYADGMSPKNEPLHDLPGTPVVTEAENSMDRVQAKYTALVHYINSMLIEVDLKQDLIHVIYNPYPDMTWVGNITSFSQMLGVLQERLVNEHRGESVLRSIRERIETFMDEGLRRSTGRFRLYGEQGSESECIEVTLLRINTMDTTRRSLAILCRKVREGSESAFRGADPVPTLPSSTLICRNDDGFTLVKLGEHMPNLLGYTREEVAACFDDQLMKLVIPEDRQKVRTDIRKQTLQSSGASTEFRARRKDGQIVWVLLRAQLSLGTDGREYLNMLLINVTAFKKEYMELEKKLDRYEIILAQTENVLFEWDVRSDTIAWSETWEKIFGFPPASRSVRESLRDGSYIHPDDVPLFLDALAKLENGSGYEMIEVRMATAWGRYLWCRFRATALRTKHGELEKISGIIINIDAEKQAEWALKSQVHRDSLTKLLNKKAARTQAEEYLAQFPGRTHGAMLIIDLDNFKYINDHFGHLFGDGVLIRVARAISQMFRDQDIVARIGGDEFMVLVRGSSDRAFLESRCQRLLNVLAGLFQNGEQKLPLSCSIGIALCPEHAVAYYELFNRADQALYRVKAQGKNGFGFYDPEEAEFPTNVAPRSEVNNPIDSDEEPGLAEDSIVHSAFQKLYTARDTDSGVREILAMIGKKLNVSRVYVFENSEDNSYCSNTYEWCNEGIRPEIDGLQHLSYETDIPDYQDNFNEQGIFYCPDVEVLTPKIYEMTQMQGIRSMLQCAIREGNAFRGFIGFDECVERRMWTKEHIRLLSYFSGMLSVFLLKRREHERVAEISRDMEALLDSQNAQMYIIDPDTWKLKYLNAKARELSARAVPGAVCYQALRGRTSHCEGCPVATIRKNETSSACICCNAEDEAMLVDAGWINWRQGDACLITARTIPPRK